MEMKLKGCCYTLKEQEEQQEEQKRRNFLNFRLTCTGFIVVFLIRVDKNFSQFLVWHVSELSQIQEVKVHLQRRHAAQRFCRADKHRNRQVWVSVCPLLIPCTNNTAKFFSGPSRIINCTSGLYSGINSGAKHGNDIHSRHGAVRLFGISCDHKTYKQTQRWGCQFTHAGGMCDLNAIYIK